jgi:hypothetical protein
MKTDDDRLISLLTNQSIKGNTIFFKGLINYGLFFLSLFMPLILYKNFENYNNGLLISVAIYCGLQVLSILFFKGSSLGMVFCNVRRIRIGEYSVYMMKLEDVIDYAFSSWGTRFKHNDSYETLDYWSSFPHQTPAMREYNILFINKRKFKRIVKQFKNENEV